MKILKGITWNHSRGYTSVVAASQRFSELYPDVEIIWEKRSLQEFADAPIENLAKSYDLLIIDHPWAGFAQRHNILLNLNQMIDEEYLLDQEKNSVGASHLSYNFNGFQSALAVDAATPISINNGIWFEKNHQKLPNDWNDVIALAKQKKVAIAGVPINLLMDYLMFGATLECEMFNGEFVLEDECALEAIENIREISNLCDPIIYELDPIGIYEMMSKDNQVIYCPYAYGYSNYSRKGYGQHLLLSSDTVMYQQKPLKTVLGGTGLAISSGCSLPDIAVEFAKFVASPIIQSTLYFEAGGQPAHRQAWLNKEVNHLSHDFFKNTLHTLDNSYLRPRYDGYLQFQDHAGIHLQEYAKNGGDPKKVIKQINQIYRDSL